jgi:hypothetical protein
MFNRLTTHAYIVLAMAVAMLVYAAVEKILRMIG